MITKPTFLVESSEKDFFYIFWRGSTFQTIKGSKDSVESNVHS